MFSKLEVFDEKDKDQNAHEKFWVIHVLRH
jgi:hypothetical protein